MNDDSEDPNTFYMDLSRPAKFMPMPTPWIRLRGIWIEIREQDVDQYPAEKIRRQDGRIWYLPNGE